MNRRLAQALPVTQDQIPIPSMGRREGWMIPSMNRCLAQALPVTRLPIPIPSMGPNPCLSTDPSWLQLFHSS
jgi:hypothetical protein